MTKPQARSEAPAAAPSLRTCPDCGGILEASPSRWVAMVDMVAGTRPEPVAPAVWQCHICGYRA